MSNSDLKVGAVYRALPHDQPGHRFIGVVSAVDGDYITGVEMWVAASGNASFQTNCTRELSGIVLMRDVVEVPLEPDHPLDTGDPLAEVERG